MRKRLLICFLLAGSITCRAQFRDLTKLDTTRQQNILNEVDIDGTRILTYRLLALRDDILSEKIIKPSDPALSEYGAQGKHGVMLIKLKPGLELVGLNQILDLYHIKGDDRKLLIFSDSGRVLHPSTLIAVKRSIARVDIVKSKFRNVNVLNIVTRNPSPMRGPFIGSESLWE